MTEIRSWDNPTLRPNSDWFSPCARRKLRRAALSWAGVLMWKSVMTIFFRENKFIIFFDENTSILFENENNLFLFANENISEKHHEPAQASRRAKAASSPG